MKYLKLFENNYYNDITEEEFNKLILKSEIEFSKVVVKKLKEIGCTIPIMNSLAYIKNDGLIYYITECIDDWFIIAVYRPNIISNNEWYKCDQIEGVTKFLKDRGVI